MNNNNINNNNINNNNINTARPVPQTSIGRLVSISVDNPKYYTANAAGSGSPPPPLIPIAAASASHNDEQTMLWRNVATLFSRCEQNETDIRAQHDDYTPCIGELNRATDDLYQETRDCKCRIAELSTELSDEINSKLRKMKKQTRKYVSKKVNKTKQAALGASFDADMEVFKYVDTIREEFKDTISLLKTEITELHNTYYRDYEMFVQRENELMAKLDAAVKMNEATNDQMKHMDEYYMRQIQQARNYADTQVAGDLREEFSTAICREVAFESKVSAQLVQGVHDELTDLITRSNEYHSSRYFGTLEEVTQIREICQTLKQSIGMVDAELSDTKETVEYFKDEIGQMSNTVADFEADLEDQKNDIYREMDCDYYDMKDYVKSRIQRHVRHSHKNTPSPVVAAAAVAEAESEVRGSTLMDQIPNEMFLDGYGATTTNDEYDDNVIIMDDTCVISDDEGKN